MKSWLVFLCAGSLFAADLPRVENGRTPTGNVTITFEEDLRLGPDQDEDHFLWAGSMVTCEVGSRGEIYIVDAGNNRILEFDADGNYQRQFGTTGQGPGEFQQLYTFHVLNDDSAIAFDNTQNAISMSFFDKNKKFVRRTPNLAQGQFIQSVKFSRDGKWFGSFWITFEEGNVHTGIMNTETLKDVLRLTKDKQVQFEQSKMGQRSWWVSFLSSWFQVPTRGTGIYGFAWDGAIFTAVNHTYEITRYDSHMKPQFVIARDYKPKPRSEEHIMAIVDPVYSEIMSLLPTEMTGILTPALIRDAVVAAELPPVKPPIYGLFPVDEEGLLIVAHDYDAVNGKVEGDIFDKSGNFVGVSELPPMQVNIFGGMFGGHTKLLIRNGFAYCMVDDEGELYMVRYRMNVDKSRS